MNTSNNQMVALYPTKLWAVPISLKTTYKQALVIAIEQIKNSQLIGTFDPVGTVTKDSIDFDTEPYLEKNNVFTTAKFTVYDKHITYTPFKDYSFYSLLSSNGLRFVNELPKPHNVGLLHTYPTGNVLMDKSLEGAIAWQAAENALVQKLLILKEI